MSVENITIREVENKGNEVVKDNPDLLAHFDKLCQTSEGNLKRVEAEGTASLTKILIGSCSPTEETELYSIVGNFLNPQQESLRS